MRYWILTLIIVFISSACGGCDSDPCEDILCTNGSVCSEGQCVDPATLCDPACEGNDVCIDSQCVTVEPQCETVREECDPALPVNEDFFCIDTDGSGPLGPECVEFCGANSECPEGTLCFVVNTNLDAACVTNDECSDGKICEQGGCRDQICRPSECEGYLAGQATCAQIYAGDPDFVNGAQCFEIGNRANFCFPAGAADVGENCLDLLSAFDIGDFEQTCQPGLACVDNTCQLACEADNDCSGDECLLAEDDLVATGVGICGQSCTPFQTGDCDPGTSCLPVDAQTGVCVPSGDKEAFEVCVPGNNDCVDGTLCVTFDNAAGIARCQPICDLTAGPAGDDGIVGDFAQTQRDATCPQPPAVGAFFQIANFAELATAVDVYMGDEMTPTFANIAFGMVTDSDAANPGEQFTELSPQQYSIRVLPAGAPRADPPLFETSLNLASESANTLVLLPVFQTPDEATGFTVPGVRNQAPPTAGTSKLRLLHGIVDVDAVDVIVVPPGDDLSVPANQTELAVSLARETLGAEVETTAGTYDLIVFPTGALRDDRANASLIVGNFEIVDGEIATVALRGTIDPDDLPIAGAEKWTFTEPPSIDSGSARFFCVDSGNEVFGWCQQTCPADGSGFGNDFCQGDGIGCIPTFLNANSDWRNLCGPVGDIEIGERCNTARTYGECGEGSYCLEYGNSQPGFDDVRRGLCTEHCVVGQPQNPNLQCADGNDCQPIIYNDDYQIGRCGFSCTPDQTYTDAVCPAGLESCKPIASSAEDPVVPPSVQVEQSFCSASGVIAVDGACSGSDCVAGSECMFPRSQQTDFLGSLLSQYFGAAGLTPVCRPQCDPFDGDSSSTTCPAGETCLFNFPWSAEVGHCAPIIETVAPLSECSSPGESCGPNSVCVVNGEANVCFEFCQYEGPNGLGQLQSSGCQGGALCNPFVNDIGVCLAP